MPIEAILARSFQLLLALTGAYTLGLWFALIVWTFRDIESRSRSVIAQIFSTLMVVLFFIPGVLIYLLLRPRETLDQAFGRALEEEYLLQDLEDLSLCANCHRPVQADYIACPHCLTELRHPCPSCNRLVDVSWSICAYCAADLVPTGEELEVQPNPELRPSLLPLPLRILRERTEVRLDHVIGSDESGGVATNGQSGSLIARETQAAGAWTDDSGKDSWFLSRAREVFAPLTGEQSATNGHGSKATNGAQQANADDAITDRQPIVLPPPAPVPTWEAQAVPTTTEPVAAKRQQTPTSRELYSYRPAPKATDEDE